MVHVLHAGCNSPRRSMTMRSYPSSEARGRGREELPHVQGAVAGWAQGGQEELLHVQGQEGQPVKRYSSSKVSSIGCALLEQCAEISHVQGKRKPNKTVGVARGHQRAETLKP